MTQKQRRESEHFKSFRYFAGEAIPDGLVTHSGAFGEVAPDGAPDFLIHADGYILGVEHREVLRANRAGQQQRAHEQDADQVLRMAQEHAELRGLQLAHVTVVFGRDEPIPKSNRLALARALVEAVRCNLPEDRTNVRIECWRYPELRSINSVHVHRDDRIRGGCRWFASRAGWVVEDCMQIIQDAIEDKASKYASYRKCCDECWLLLVADSFRPSSLLRPDQRSLEHVYSSPFERTYFLDYGVGRLHALRTTHGK